MPGTADIGGLVSGQTYKVTNVNNGDDAGTAGTFQLTPAGGGFDIVLGPGTTSGASHQLTPNGIAIGPGSGSQTLTIDFSGGSTGSPTGDVILVPAHGQFFVPPPGTGESTSDAQGGSGGVIAAGLPTASTTFNPDVQAYVAAAQVNAGGNVAIGSQAIAFTSSHANNAGGGLGFGGVAQESTNFGGSNLAWVGTPGGNASNVAINAQAPSR